MIKEIFLENWKSFSPSKLYIDPLTVLIGTNASGKSNLLDAFWFLSRLAMGHSVESIFKEIRGGKEWIIRKGENQATLTIVLAKDIRSVEYHFTIKVKRSGDRVGIAEESMKQVDHNKVVAVYHNGSTRPERRPVETNIFHSYSDNLAQPYATVYTRRSSRGPEKSYEMSRTTSVLSQMGSIETLPSIKDCVSLVVKELSNIFVLNPIPNNMRDYSTLSDMLETDASNIAGVLSAMEKEKREQVEKTLSEYLRPLPEKDIKRVWTERVGKFNTDAMLYCNEQWKGNEITTIDSRSMSDGTLRFLAIATAMLTRPRGSLLIVEEVDNGLHPSRTSELVMMLRKLGEEQGIDILCTTHNPVMLDKLGIELLPIVFFVKRDPKTGGSVVEAVEGINNLPKLLAQYSMGDLMTEGKL